MERLLLRLRPDRNAPARARLAFRERFEDRFAPDHLADALLLVGEVVTNAVVHQREGTVRPIHLTAHWRDGKLRTEVCDGNMGFDPEKLPPPGPEGGWGLALVKEIAEDWGVRQDDRVCVWFDLDPRLPTRELTALPRALA
jgi:anti-sigma regulatory factor (Ser/Thr protein kinase)